jgi:hypothetical protein
MPIDNSSKSPPRERTKSRRSFDSALEDASGGHPTSQSVPLQSKLSWHGIQHVPVLLSAQLAQASREEIARPINPEPDARSSAGLNQAMALSK